MAATILRLNFRGVNVELDVQVLERGAPDSRLHRLAHGREKLPLDNEGRHFIDRSPLLFHHILDYYASGRLDFPAQYSWAEVKDELDYWQVDQAALSPWCVVRYDDEMRPVREADMYNAYYERYDRMASGTMCPAGAQRMRGAWEFLDVPKSSGPALVFSILTCVILPLALATNYVVGTLQIVYHDGHTADRHYLPQGYTQRIVSKFYDTDKLPLIDIHFLVHVAVLGLILIEMLIRFIVWPSKCQFLLDALNWADIIALLGATAGLLMANLLPPFDLKKWLMVVYLCNAAIALFLFRWLRIWRCYDSYRVLIKALQSTAKDFFLTACMFFVLMVVFTFFVYWANIEELDSHYLNMGDGLYWAIVTMTTVGYGDIIPLGIAGKCVGALCAMSGVLMIILPLAAFIHNYQQTKELLGAAKALRTQQRKQGITYVPPTGTMTHGEAGLYPPPPTDVAAL